MSAGRFAAVLALFGAVAMLPGGNVPADAASHWRGWYTGAFVGYAWTDTEYVVPPDSFSNRTSGFIGGGFLGYNDFLTDTVIAGVEANVGFSSLSLAQFRCALTGRIGNLVRPTILIYGLAGPACGHSTARVVASNNVMTLFLDEREVPRLITTTTTAEAKSDKILFGWTAGIGIEVDDQWLSFPLRWSLEYRYTDFQGWNFSLLGQDFSVNPDVQDVRLRLIFPLN